MQEDNKNQPLKQVIDIKRRREERKQASGQSEGMGALLLEAARDLVSRGGSDVTILVTPAGPKSDVVPLYRLDTRTNVLAQVSDKELEGEIFRARPTLVDKHRKEVIKFAKLMVATEASIDFETVQPVAFSDELDVITWNRLPLKRSELEDLTLEELPEFAHILSLCDDPRALVLWFGRLLDYRASRAQYLHWYGGGGNGKSTLVAAIERVLGHRYVVRTRSTDFHSPHWGSNIEGTRLLVLAEENSASATTSGKFKEFTGEPTVSVNPKYEQPRTIKLTHMTIVMSNTRVEITNNAADRRRLVSITMQDDPEKNLGHKWWYEGLLASGAKILSYCYGEYLRELERNPTVRAAIEQSSEITAAAVARKYDDLTDVILDSFNVTGNPDDVLKSTAVFELLSEKMGVSRSNPVFAQMIRDALALLGVERFKNSTYFFRGIRNGTTGVGTKGAIDAKLRAGQVSKQVIPS